MSKILIDIDPNPEDCVYCGECKKLTTLPLQPFCMIFNQFLDPSFDKEGDHERLSECINAEENAKNKKRFLVFAGQEYYANGGANDLASIACKTKNEAIKYADSLIGKEFTTHFWYEKDSKHMVSMEVEWAHVFDLKKCEVIYRTGNIFGDENGIIILGE